MKVSYCMKCRKEVGEDIKQCECGCKMFAFGESGYFKFNEEGNIVCKCGSEKFRRGSHIDYSNKAVNNYVCLNCNTLIGTESYRDEEDPMYWGMEEM